jgi:uncharacterized protein (TIGR03118 family)
MRRIALQLLALLSIVTAGPLLSVHAQAYKVTNLVSDGSVPAITMDPNFLNPWGISVSSTWWIGTANSGFDYVVPATTDTIAFKVIIPSASGSTTATSLPAGSVTTTGASGMVLSNGTKASFLFSTLDGAIAGWNSKLGTASAVTLIAINNTAAGASYPGLAILNVNATTSYILAANFGTGNAIEVYDSTFKPTRLAGSFTDPSLPAGYAPFSIHILNNQVWVAYALRPASAPYVPVNGIGNGLVDVFDTSGNFVSRAVTGGNLNAPWGVAFAPAGFGIFSGDLLIGNFGDGNINVFDPKTYAFLGQLMDATGKALNYPSLWELLPGGTAVGNSTSVSGGDTSTVYFTAGLTNQAHGLLAGIASTTTSGSTPAFGFSASTGAASVAAGSAVQAALSVAPVNGFNGTVTFACSGLPTGAVCNFSPLSLNVTSSAPAISQLSITTTQAMARVALPHRGKDTAALAFALLLPFSSLLLARRRRFTGRLGPFGPLAALILSVGVAALVLGCADSSPSVQATPAGQSNVVITATAASGATRQTTIGLTVK